MKPHFKKKRRKMDDPVNDHSTSTASRERRLFHNALALPARESGQRAHSTLNPAPDGLQGAVAHSDASEGLDTDTVGDVYVAGAPAPDLEAGDFAQDLDSDAPRPLREAAPNAASPIRRHARRDLGYVSDIADAYDSDDSDELEADGIEYAPFETQMEDGQDDHFSAAIPDCEEKSRSPSRT
jgi:hypothetical protein